MVRPAKCDRRSTHRHMHGLSASQSIINQIRKDHKCYNAVQYSTVNKKEETMCNTERRKRDPCWRCLHLYDIPSRRGICALIRNRRNLRTIKKTSMHVIICILAPSTCYKRTGKRKNGIIKTWYYTVNCSLACLQLNWSGTLTSWQNTAKVSETYLSNQPTTVL